VIQIYTNSNPDVNLNGIIINPISCEISPKLNSENELEMEFPIDNDDLYKYIQNNNYIAVPTPDYTENQLYRIYDTKKSMSSYSIIAYARHIEFDLAKSVIFNKSLSISNGQQALNRLLEDTSFTGHSDITIQDIRQYKMRSVMNVINGSEDDSFINVWGGELSCNNYDLTVNTKRGSDKGVRVTFGYNLEDIEEELIFDDVITRLYPYSGDLVLSSNTPYIDSPLIANIGVLEDKIEFSDIKVKEKAEDTEGFDTRAQAEAEMIRRCNKLYDKGLDKITANYVVKMQDLSKTTEYKKLGYDVLEKICLGDTVHCYNKNIDIEVEARCISYKWDCIEEEYIEIELGQFISSYVNMQNNRLDNLYRTIQLTEQNILLQVTSLDNNLNAKIELTAGQIRDEVTDTKNQLESSITQTASSIREEVTDLSNHTSASITLLSNEIESKVSDDEVYSIIEQASDEVKVAFNGISDYVSITTGGLKLGNTDSDDYSLVSSKGLLHYDGATGVPYHYHTQTGTITFTNAEDVESYTIDLDDEFQNASPHGIACINKVTHEGEYAMYWVASYISNISTTSMSAKISGQANYRDWSDASQDGGTIVVSYLIVG